MSMDWNPRSKYQRLISLIQDILSSGERRTVRDIYYALESRGHHYNYDEVKRAVKKGRWAGYIDPEQIYDSSRQAITEMRNGPSSPESFLDNATNHIKHGYFENFWDDQSAYVEVWLEKAALASVFQPICDDLNVRLEATRGDWSDSKVYRATQRLASEISDGKDVKVLYFGDFNPSGYHAPVIVQEKMEYYGIDLNRKETDPYYFEIWPFDGPVEFETGGTLYFDRVAMVLEHVERFDLPENPTPSSTQKDATIKERFLKYVSNGRDTDIELNALKEYHREFLEDRLRESIKEYVDESQREKTEQRIEHRQETLRETIEIDKSPIEDI